MAWRGRRWPRSEMLSLPAFTRCLTAAILAVTGCVFSAVEGVAAPRRPNIVIVMPDDVGYGDYACLGNPIVQTPAADRF